MNRLRIVIVEDEQPATERLVRLLKKVDKNLEIVTTLDSVQRSIEFFSSRTDFDLIFMDIQLGDGLSLEIFDQVKLTRPVIFVTAYDDYTLKAFKVNSLDYLLKPIDLDDLNKAMNQYYSIRDNFKVEKADLDELGEALGKNKYRQRFLVKKSGGLKVINLEDIAYFFSEDGYVHIMETNGIKHIIDTTLDNLLEELDPEEFYKINRKMIVRHGSIGKIDNYFNSRLQLEMIPPAPHTVIVSREKCKAFKAWLSD